MNRRIPRRLVRVAGWLLTPIVVWAASFFGGWLGAVLRGSDAGGAAGLLWLTGGALVGGVIGGAGWIVLMWWAGRRAEPKRPSDGAPQTRDPADPAGTGRE